MLYATPKREFRDVIMHSVNIGGDNWPFEGHWVFLQFFCDFQNAPTPTVMIIFQPNLFINTPYDRPSKCTSYNFEIQSF